MDALHGELGLVGSADLLIVLSKSGTTGELVALTRAAKQRNAKIAAMVCRSSSPLAKLADWIISVQIEQEATDIEVPTASTVAMSALGDALMIAVAHGRGFTAAEFSHNHPAGNLGVLLGSQVDELMLRIPGSVPMVSSQDLLRDVVIEMTRHPVGAAIVADSEGKLVGLITDGDLRRQIQSSPEAFLQATVDACMTPEPLYCQSGMSALEAMRFMEQNPRKPVYVLPDVDEDHKVLGLLRMHDLATLQMKEGNVDV
jgi:arabinose-5-phosphate isomerase